MALLLLPIRALLAATLFMASGPVFASIVITGTRVIYPAEASEVTVKLNNSGTRPALVQSWIDRGDIASTPSSAEAPFMLSPPVTRIDPGKGQSLRVMATSSTLPKDRESVFWLNVLDIPPEVQAEAGANLLQMAFRSRIKIFFRPSRLPGSATDAMSRLEWRLDFSESGEGHVLRAFNPTAFHVSLVGLSVGHGEQRAPSEDGMVAPGATAAFPVKTLALPISENVDVSFSAINDHGALIQVRSRLHP
ncbi:fimbria/pilus periplasmic chaperone [Stenotrophomonas maltophilia]|nr:fimbria/pilus periplasmic chaperone [Stenotrophomonas maltophilia]